MQEHPNLLIFGDYPSGYANGVGETLDNLLEGYPDAKLFQSHAANRPVPPERRRGTLCPFAISERPAMLPRALWLPYHLILKLRQARDAARLYKNTVHLIERRSIQTMLTYPTSAWLLFTALRIVRKFPALRLIFYVMDDWLGHHVCYHLPYTMRRQAAYDELVHRAQTRFACSQLMAADYSRRDQLDWEVLHKGVRWPIEFPAPSPFSGIRRILYAGDINVFRFDAVQSLVEGLALYRQRTGQTIILETIGYVEERCRDALAAFDVVKMSPRVSNQACQQMMREADMLYLPLAFSPDLDRIVRFAMPTKFPEYLASGRPVLVHAPPSSEVIRTTVQAGLQPTLTSVDSTDACALLCRIQQEGIDMVSHCANASQLLHAEFDQAKLQEALRLACVG